jgi:hypothetical protein
MNFVSLSARMIVQRYAFSGNECSVLRALWEQYPVRVAASPCQGIFEIIDRLQCPLDAVRRTRDIALNVSGTCLARRLHEAANAPLYNVVNYVDKGINIMSIFGTILSKIFPSSHPAITAPAAPPAADPTTAPAAAPAPAAAAEPVDVEAVLTAMQANTSEQLNWRTSIVDLMKLLGLDSSLSARKELAGELHYPGDTNDSASMNIWLHKAVMAQLAANGGKVPDSLKG